MAHGDHGKTQRPPGTAASADPGDTDQFDDVATYIPGKSGPNPQAERIVAYLEIVEGHGRGVRLPIWTGTNPIGRDPAANRIVLAFGDQTISREGHAVIVAHAASGQSDTSLTLYDGGKPNPVHVNGTPVRGSVQLSPQDRITLGATAVQMVSP